MTFLYWGLVMSRFDLIREFHSFFKVLSDSDFLNETLNCHNWGTTPPLLMMFAYFAISPSSEMYLNVNLGSRLSKKRYTQWWVLFVSQGIKVDASKASKQPDAILREREREREVREDCIWSVYVCVNEMPCSN